MKRLGAVLSVLMLSGGIALAQGSGGGSSGGSSGGSGGASTGGGASSGPSATQGTTGTAASQDPTRSGTGSSATPGAQVNGPNNTGGPVPGLSTPSASDSATVGRAPGVNPGNPQDASRRRNPSDRTLPGASNPQDMRAFDSAGTPQIMKPEK
jgi:hypothetical protein